MSSREAAELLLLKAERACDSAAMLLEAGDVDGACNRAYFAMFDAARAALHVHVPDADSSLGKTHRGLIASFGLCLVKPGLVSRELGKSLKRAEETRLVADYRSESVTRDDAQELVREAFGFVRAMRDLCGSD
jgi:uncharacterized protein (UPF0332 family)